MTNSTNNFALFLLLLLTLPVSAKAAAVPDPSERAVTFRTRTMGTVAGLTLVTADSASVAELAYQALVSLHQIDSLMTNWTETSETARINRLAGSRTLVLDPAFNDLLSTAEQIGRATDGAFDITVEPLVRLWGFIGGHPTIPQPSDIAATLAAVGWQQLDHDPQAGTIHFAGPDTRIDLGGIAKGYGVDRVADILRSHGVTRALIDLSGNMVALGAPPGKSAWTLGIMDPADRTTTLGHISLRNAAVATSGNYLQYVMSTSDGDTTRYGHILDPRTGWPATGLASATVIAPAATTADAWATALIVLDPSRARDLARQHAELQVVLVEPAQAGSRVIWVEEALRGRFIPRETAGDTLIVRYF